MAEYSRGSFNGRLRDWRSRRAEARAAARWPTPPAPAPDSPPAENPLAARWVPESERHREAQAPAAPALSEPSRWLTGGADRPTDAPTPPSGSTALLTAAAPGAAAWLPEDLKGREQVTSAQLGPSRWVPTGTADAEAPDESTDHRRAAVEAYCRVICQASAVAAATSEALDEGDDGDASLLRATRTAAAARAVPVAMPTTWRQRLAAEHEHPCAPTQHRLAERANGTLSGREERELEQHLSGCEQCREADQREQQATAAFVVLLPGATEFAHLDADSARWVPPTGAAAAAAAATTPAAQPRRRRRKPAVLLLVGAACLAAVIAVAAVLLVKSNRTTHHTPAPTAQVTVHTQTATTPSRAKASTARHHKKPVVHHKATRHRKTVVHKPTHPAVRTVSSVPVTRTVTPTYVAPVTPRAVTPTAPVQPSGTSVSTVSQPSLPKESAPQSGVGKPGK